MLPSDRPDDKTIDDDEALDRWYEGYQREMAIALGKKSAQGAFAEQVQIPQFGK